MVYSVLDDRPNKCEGCGSPDYPSQFGPSARQIMWNSILGLWVCVDCQYSWSNWMGTRWDSDVIRRAKKPGFLIMLEKEAAENGRS